MTIHIVKRTFRQFLSLLPVLALSVGLSGCDTGQSLGKFQTELQVTDDSFTVNEDEMFAGDVSTNDSLGAGRSYSVGSGPANGILDLSADGSFTYMPNADFFGSDSFAINVSYADGTSASTTVSLTIGNAPDTLEEFGWAMVWSDEFDGTELNAANWTPQIGDGSEFGLDRWGNNEQQWYLAENITVADGNLVIAARAEEVVAEFPYTSGRMRSIDKVDVKYGRIEARVQAPTGVGLWSAFWMMPTDSPYNGWASNGEIDIMEVINAPDDGAFGTLHYGFPWPLNQLSGQPVEVAADDGFHTYAIEWEQDEIRWYIDDVHYNTISSDTWYSYFYGDQETGYVSGPDRAPFDVDFHILLNLAVGGFLSGSVEPETVFPAELLVDYVRVYECSADPVTGEGCASWVDDSIEGPAASDAFVYSVDLYTDGAGTLTWAFGEETVSRDLAFTSFFDNEGALILSEVEADDASHGLVIDVNTIDSGNFSFYAESVVSVNGVPIDHDEPISLFGMGNNPNWWELHAAELKFDLYIDSAGTDVDSSLLVKMDSGFPAVGSVEMPVADLPLDQWTTISVKVNDLLANCGDSCLDTSEVIGLFVLEPTGMAHVQLDNIQLVCGYPSNNGCGIKAPVSEGAPPPPTGGGDPVPGQLYIDATDPAWALWDCCGGSVFTEVDSGDPAHGQVAQFTYLAAPTVNGFDSVAAAGEDLTSFAGGTLEFDVYLANPPNGSAPDSGTWLLKLEGPGAVPALEVSLTDSVEGVEPTVGAWQHYTFNLDDLGFPLDAVKIVMIFPTWGSGDGAVVWYDNVQFKAPPGQIYIDFVDPAWALWDCCGGSVFAEVDSGDPAHGNVAQFSYLAAPTVNGFDSVAAEGEDLTSLAGGTLEFDVYLATPPNASAPDVGVWNLKLEGPGAVPALEVPLTDSVEGVQPPLGAWQHYTFNLDDLGFALDAVKIVMIFPTWGTGDGAVVWYDNVSFIKPPPAP